MSTGHPHSQSGGKQLQLPTDLVMALLHTDARTIVIGGNSFVKSPTMDSIHLVGTYVFNGNEAFTGRIHFMGFHIFKNI